MSGAWGNVIFVRLSRKIKYPRLWFPCSFVTPLCLTSKRKGKYHCSKLSGDFAIWGYWFSAYFLLGFCALYWIDSHSCSHVGSEVWELCFTYFFFLKTHSQWLPLIFHLNWLSIFFYWCHWELFGDFLVFFLLQAPWFLLYLNSWFSPGILSADFFLLSSLINTAFYLINCHDFKYLHICDSQIFNFTLRYNPEIYNSILIPVIFVKYYTYFPSTSEALVISTWILCYIRSYILY